MTIDIYIDALKGNDSQGNGSSSNPYKTLEYFCNNIAIKNNGDYTVYLKKGTYEITSNNIFGQFVSGSLTFVGLGKKTEILQKTGMYINTVGGHANFTLNITKCRYNILTDLTSHNLMGFNWSWNFYNVLFEYTPNNSYSVFSSATSMTIRNCVKLTSTTSFLRKNSSTISVYDSMGYFTSGYSTSQSDWDKGGNTIGSISDYERILKKGLYKWETDKTLILHDSKYKKYNGYIPSVPPSVSKNTIIPAMTSNTSPTGEAFSNKNPESAFRLFDGNYSSAYPMSYRQQDAIIGYNFMKEVKIVKYGIICAKYYGLSAWKFEGSSDGVNWTTLDSQTGQSWNEGGEKIYTITSANYYERYRINFSKTQNFESTSFYELKMYEYIEEIPSIPYYWSTVSSTLPNSTEFIEKGMDNLSPLFDRTLTTLESMEMTNKSEILGASGNVKVFSKTIDLKKYFDIKKVRAVVK
ncbi:hypothetical protein B1B04_09190 [Lysinibacillus sp. KCTC 33748]|uniref:hypothetical protein n=1 Tax=unclassified Lysinibacillus TaxID=2636778 RepID=UPI0009A78908|nr:MULTISPECIES: hypothetical protein [unclassified Lysinibacillus]OXS74291.1 hypothetical protein B1B04_09190 [Lysinibacillus sp. KCTC 33748]SKB63766.1 hypothetical protein SAMN06295926_10519 [Lysinibacillus sp. AC-3]